MQYTTYYLANVRVNIFFSRAKSNKVKAEMKDFINKEIFLHAYVES